MGREVSATTLACRATPTHLAVGGACAVASLVLLAGCQPVSCVSGCADGGGDAGPVADAGPGLDAGFEGDAGPLGCAVQSRTPPPGELRIENAAGCPGMPGQIRPIPAGAAMAAAFGPFEREVRIDRVSYVLSGREIIGECRTDIEHHVGVFTGQDPLTTADASPVFRVWQAVRMASDIPGDGVMDVALDPAPVIEAGQEVFVVIVIPGRATDADPSLCSAVCRPGLECNRDWVSAGDEPPFAWQLFFLQTMQSSLVLDIVGEVL